MDFPPLVSISLLAACVAWAAPASAQVYKWVDERGVTHYGQKPPPASARDSRVRELDIDLTGNDPTPARGECYTIRCQYERLRADRLEREEELRRDWEARQRASAAQKQAEAAARTQTDDRWVGGGPVVVRPRPVVPGLHPGVRPSPVPRPPQGEPSVSLKSPGE